MAPSTRNSLICEQCGVLTVRVGKGEEESSSNLEIRCQKCWSLKVLSLEDRVKELENRSPEVEEQDSFKECCECDDLRVKVVELEKEIGKKGGGNGRIKKLEEEIKENEKKIQEGVIHNNRYLEELTGLKINREKLKVTVDEYGRSLAVKETLISKMEEAATRMRGEISAFKLQLEEYKRLSQGTESDEAGVAKAQWGEWSHVGRSPGTYADKISRTGSRPQNVVRNREVRQPEANVRMIEKERRGTGKDKVVIIGDSMIRNVDKMVGMKEEGSYRKCLSGAGVKQIVSEAIVASEKVTEDTRLFIQGGGNSLKTLGAGETVRSIVEGARQICKTNQKVWTIVLSVAPRPRENGRYESERLKTNEMLFHEIKKLHKEDGLKVTFMGMDPCLNLDCFGSDGVHFNFEGNKAISRIIISVIKSRPRVNREEVQNRN